MQDAHQIRLEIPSTAEYVGVVRQAIEGIAKRMHFTAADVDDVKLAVGEACNNAVKHGRPSGKRPFITVICTVTPGCLEVEVSNSIAGPEPCPAAFNPPDCTREGGMGLYIMRTLMDEVDIFWRNRTARIRMVKRVKAS